MKKTYKKIKKRVQRYIGNENNNNDQEYLSKLPDELLYLLSAYYLGRNELLKLKLLSRWFNKKITEIDQNLECGFWNSTNSKEAEISKLIQTKDYDESKSFSYVGSAHFARIYSSSLNTTSEKIAIKIFNYFVKEESKPGMFFSGLNQLNQNTRHIKHPNLVSYYGFGIKKTEKIKNSENGRRRGKFVIITEYLPNITMTFGLIRYGIQTMEDYMVNYKNHAKQFQLKIPAEFHDIYNGIPNEMFIAMNLLHNNQPKPIYHGNLNSLNKLFLWRGKDGNFHIKINGWGSQLVNQQMKGSYVKQKACDVLPIGGQTKFISLHENNDSATPERLTNEYYGLKSHSPWIKEANDIYQLFLLMDAIFRNEPRPRIFRNEKGAEIPINSITSIIRQNQYFHKFSENAPPILQKIGFFALHPNPKERPTIEHALECIKKNTVPEDGFNDCEKFEDKKITMK